MNKVKEIARFIFSKPNAEGVNAELSNTKVLFWGALILMLAALLLTLFNVVMGYWFMVITTVCLAVGFFSASMLARIKHLTESRCVIVVFCAVMFTFYAVTGENEGFAILWILLVPALSMLMLGLRGGFILSLYFQLFLVVLLYTPLFPSVNSYYSGTFIMRFPVLYLTMFVAATFLMYELQKLNAIATEQASRDGLTGLLNRRRATEMAAKLDEEAPGDELCLVSLDVNRLKWTNDNLGHEAGDELIVATAQLMREAFPDDPCFRIGGDEFLVLCQRHGVDENVADLRKRASAWHGRLVEGIAFSIGVASRAELPGGDFHELLKLADVRMYQDKSAFYRQTQHDRRTR